MEVFARFSWSRFFRVRIQGLVQDLEVAALKRFHEFPVERILIFCLKDLVLAWYYFEWNYKLKRSSSAGPLEIKKRNLFENVWKTSRCSRPEAFCKNAGLKNFEKFTGEYLCWSSFFSDIEELGPKPSTLLKKELRRSCSPGYFTKFFNFINPFYVTGLFPYPLKYQKTSNLFMFLGVSGVYLSTNQLSLNDKKLKLELFF